MKEAEPYLLMKLGIKTKKSNRTLNKTNYRNTSNPYTAYFRNLNSSTIDGLREIFKEDLEIFDFPKSPFD